MSSLICTTCDRPFDTDIQCDAIYYPIPKCEDCVQNEFERVQEDGS